MGWPRLGEQTDLFGLFKPKKQPCHVVPGDKWLRVDCPLRSDEGLFKGESQGWDVHQLAEFLPSR